MDAILSPQFAQLKQLLHYKQAHFQHFLSNRSSIAAVGTEMQGAEVVS